jgi:PAS domain S-box-containing protein
MKKTRFGLIAKIAVLVGIVEFIAFSIFGYLYAEKYSQKIEKVIINKISMVNKMIANEQLPIGSISNIEFMNDLLGEPYILGAITGGSDFIIASSKSQYLGKNINTITEFSKNWLFKEFDEKIFIENNNLTTVSNISSKVGNSRLYRIIIQIDIKNHIKEKNNIIVLSTLGAILFILFSTFTIILIAKRFISSRIEQSLSVLNKAESGDLKSAIVVENLDEIGLLQSGINSMIKKVGSSLLKYKELNERFELTLDAVNDGIWDWDITTNKTYFSKKWKGMLGYSDDEIQNNAEAFFELIHDDDKQKVKETIEKHFKDPMNHQYNIEIQLKCKDGSYKFILARGKAIFDENKTPIRMLGYHTDITKEKKINKN